MKKGYSGASFSTTGFWLIPWILGWSKSVVSFGYQPIGIMFTIHITPFLNIGVNNPKPKRKPIPEISEKDLPNKYACGCNCDCTDGCCGSENKNVNQNQNPIAGWICPRCGNIENFEFNYDETKNNRPLISLLCLDCGEVFTK